MEIQEPFKRNDYQLFVVFISLYNMVGSQCSCNHPKQVDQVCIFVSYSFSHLEAPRMIFWCLTNFNVCAKHVMLCEWMDAN